MTLKQLSSVFITSLLCVSANVYANNSELILGKWNCDVSTVQDGLNVDMTINQNYLKNGVNNGSAIMAVTNEAIGLDVAFNIEADSNWHIEGNFIYETLTGGSFESLKPSPFDAMFTKEQMLPIGEQEVAEILELTQSSLKVLAQGIEMQCNR